MATRPGAMPKAAVSPSLRPASLLPPPARKRAEGASPLTSITLPAISLHKIPEVPWMHWKISSLETR